MGGAESGGSGSVRWGYAREEEGAADAWGQTISDTRGEEGNDAGAAATGPASGMGRGEAGHTGMEVRPSWLVKGEKAERELGCSGRKPRKE